MKPPHNRRRFLGVAGQAITVVGAALAGLVPELSARGATATFGAAAGGSPPPEIPATPPPVPSLDPNAQATLYSQALNDAEVIGLLGILPEAGRLGPPTQSSDLALDANVRSQQVMMPVTGYTSGLVLAYLIYGSASGMTYDGVPVPVPVKMLMTHAGRALFAVRGALQDVSSVDPMPTLFAYLFPEAFAAQLGKAVATVGASEGLAERLMRKVGVRVARAVDTDRGDCYRIAELALSTCIANTNGSYQSALGGLGVAVVCMAYGLLVVGTGGVAGITWAYLCSGAVGAFAGLVIAYKAELAACQTVFNGAVRLCQRKFPIATVVAA